MIFRRSARRAFLFSLAISSAFAGDPILGVSTEDPGTLHVRIADLNAVSRMSDAVWIAQVRQAFAAFTAADAAAWENIVLTIGDCASVPHLNGQCRFEFAGPARADYAVFAAAVRKGAWATLQDIGPGDPILEQLLAGAWKGAKTAIAEYDLSWWAVGGFAAGFLASGPGGVAVFVAKAVQFLSKASIAYMAVEIGAALANGQYERAGELFGQAAILYLVTTGGYKAGNKARMALEKQRERIVLAQTQAAQQATRPNPPATRPVSRAPSRHPAPRSGTSRRSTAPRPPRRPGPAPREQGTPARPTQRQIDEAWERLSDGSDGDVLVIDAPVAVASAPHVAAAVRPAGRGSASPRPVRPSAPIASAPPVAAPVIARLPLNAVATLPLTAVASGALQAPAVAPILPLQTQAAMLSAGYEAVAVQPAQANHEIAAYRLFKLLQGRAESVGETLDFVVPEVQRGADGKLYRVTASTRAIERATIPSELIAFDWLIGFAERSVSRNVGSAVAAPTVTVARGHAAAFRPWTSEEWLASTWNNENGDRPYAQPIRWEAVKSNLPQYPIFRALQRTSFEDIESALAASEGSLLTEQELYSLRQRYVGLVYIRHWANSHDARRYAAADADGDDALREYLRKRQAPTTTFDVIQKLLSGEMLVLGSDLGTDAALAWLRKQCAEKKERDAYPPREACAKLERMFAAAPEARMDLTDLWSRIIEGARAGGEGGFDFYGTEIRYHWDGETFVVYEAIPKADANKVGRSFFSAKATYSASTDSVEFTIFIRENVTKKRTARTRYVFGREFIVRSLEFMETELKRPIRRVRTKWVRHPAEHMDRSDNFDEFHKNLKKMARTRAAKATWTGKVLSSLGFSEVIEIEQPRFMVDDDGFGGPIFDIMGLSRRGAASKQVEFYFSKPE